MEKMTLNRALKLKARKTKELNGLWSTISRVNSYTEGSPVRYDVNELLAEAIVLQGEVVDLKTRIHLANAPVYGVIFELAALKVQRAKLNDVDTKEGINELGYRGDTTIYVAQVTDDVVAGMVKELDNEVDRLQDQLDSFNATTHIE